MYSDTIDPAFVIDGIVAYRGHALDVLATLPEQCVSTVVTSPPYWAKRCYAGEPTVWGGDPACQHEWCWTPPPTKNAKQGSTEVIKYPNLVLEGTKAPPSDTCRCCGAYRGQYGLEPTPELYIEHSMLVLDALWRVLRDDGVLWWNVADTRAAGGGFGSGKEGYVDNKFTKSRTAPIGLKPKDLCLIPLRFVMAAQHRGWYVRSNVIWQKPNVKPESIKDRPTDSYEYIFMLTKSERYWYDFAAVLEPALTNSYGGAREDTDQKAGRNLRDVWSMTTHPYPGAHFAPFPPELPRRCIEAGCPAEICLRCGRPRVRLVEKITAFEGGSGRAGRTAEELNDSGKWRGGYSGKNLKLGPVVARKTVGWSDCGCGAEFVPGIVLDPFAGTGTTGMAARELGRDCILIETAQKYIEQMRIRLTMGDAEIRRRAKAERDQSDD